jgi:hypothetical protein
MKSLAILLASALLLAGCATQPKEQLAAARSAGVSPEVMHKIERWGYLSPGDIIELKRRHVNDAIALRQLDRIGVDYIVDKDTLRQLRKAGVSELVVSAVILAGRRFEEQFQQHRVGYWYGAAYGPWGPYDPFLYDLGRPYPRPPYGPGPGGPDGFRGGGGPGGGGPGGPGGGGGFRGGPR